MLEVNHHDISFRSMLRSWQVSFRSLAPDKSLEKVPAEDQAPNGEHVVLCDGYTTYFRSEVYSTHALI